ncbi:putative U-box domain-containing protein 50 [Macadamia integrifolia]|uniref:putative U-box domain-containing protein 50 n=1 Tax=Macadamia integrifolia TaxID=60698 RepID=UPI001C4E2EF5|nr:putative U-box domain-containing protein 50 [Macadamia integrifolia]
MNTFSGMNHSVSGSQTMNNQVEKIYIAVGNDLNEGIGTLEWAIKKWSGQTISFVIVHVDNTSRDFVNTPFGKLPASSVNEEKLKIIRMLEQDKIDKTLFKFKAFCNGKVKSEVLKIEKSEEPIHKEIVEFISTHQVTKLVLGITVVKTSSWKTKTAISASFYIHRHKPSFCELFIICGGKLVFLREENDEKHMEDERGVMVAKMRETGSLISRFGKMFIDNSTKHETQGGVYPRGFSPAREVIDTEIPVSSRDWWEDYAPQVDSYFQWLLSSSKLVEEEEDEDEEEEYRATRYGLSEEGIVEHDSHDQITESLNGIEILKAKIQEAQKIIEEKRKEVESYVEGQIGAQNIISLCNRRVEELEARIKEEVDKNQVEKNKLEAARENIYEISSDIEQIKSRLNSLIELQSELTTKLQSSSLAKSHVEAQLENAIAAKTEIEREMDELRRQRELLHRRIEFCKKRDAIAATTKSSSSVSESDELNYSYREFTAEDIISATANFSEHMRLKKRCEQTNYYRGRLNHMGVAIELHDSLTSLSEEDFRAKMELLSQIHHPHLIQMMGACPELRCIVSQYMNNGCLQNFLLSTQRNPSSYSRNQSLYWHTRIRIIAEACMGLGFLHLFEPRPILHGELNLSNVILDRNMVAKLTVTQLSQCFDESKLRSELYDFGVVMLQVLTSREGDGLVEEVKRAMEGEALHGILDPMAGDWPMDLAMEFARIALRCVDINGSVELTTCRVMEEIEELRRKAEELIAKEGFEMGVEGSGHREKDQEHGDVPYIFLCPILQEVMKNPHVAADGFSYELGAIEEWLGSGHDTSPMTNLRLEHKLLTPNQTLRSLIQEWLNNRATSS